jgi:hypothetical protein
MGYDASSKQSRGNPSLPKTIGTLNLIFGGMLLLCGFGCLANSMTAFGGEKGFQVDPKFAQEVVDKMKEEMVDDLKTQEKAASNPEEKARLKKEREELEAKPMRIDDKVDFKRLNRALASLRIYIGVEVVTGPILNVLMLISGIGLLQLKGWARTMGIWVALLKMLRLIGLTAFLCVAVIPTLSSAMGQALESPMGEAVMAKAMEQQKARPGGAAQPMPPLKDIVEMFKVMGYVYAIGYACLGVVYPLVAVLVLTRSGARDACAREMTIDDGFHGPPAQFG